MNVVALAGSRAAQLRFRSDSSISRPSSSQRAAPEAAGSARIRSRTLERWKLPPGVPVNERVTLRFKLDVAGSASSVQVVAASDNALGASAVDAMRSASPFPPIPEAARCLAQGRIRATFSSESVAG